MKYHNVLFLFIIFSLAVVSCEKDNPQELKENNTLVEQANKLLSDTIVLSTKAKIGTTDKTLLENGCPAKYYFQWNAEKEKLYMRLVKF